MKVTSVTQLATDKTVTFDQQADGLHLVLPTQPSGVHVYVYRIDMHEDSIKANGEGSASKS
jgi:alpha-L-fucosidase